MSKSSSVTVRLTYHIDSSSTEQDDGYYYLIEKLNELIDECSAFKSYNIDTQFYWLDR